MVTAAPEHTGPSSTAKPSAIRARAVVALALLIPPFIFFMVWGNWLVGGTGPGGSMFGPAVATVCLSVLLNVALKRLRPRWSFTAAELVTIYVIVAIAAGMISSVWDWFGALAPVIAFPVWQASPANHWAETVLPNLAPWLIVSDKSALEGFFLGNSTAYRIEILRAWATPALWWTAWTVGLTWVTLCSNVIVRRRWSEQEKLPFPMTELPLRLVEPGGGLLRDPFWWTGVAVSSAIGVLIILSAFFPLVPTVPLGLDLSSYINNNHPWDALRCWRLSWGPWGIGISYLMPVDMAFSLVVFNLMWRARVCGLSLARVERLELHGVPVRRSADRRGFPGDDGGGHLAGPPLPAPGAEAGLRAAIPGR